MLFSTVEQMRQSQSQSEIALPRARAFFAKTSAMTWDRVEDSGLKI